VAPDDGRFDEATLNFSVIAIGTTGDVVPLIALGRGLARAGHVVTIAAPLNFENAVLDQGLQYRPIRVDFRHIFDGPEGQVLLNGKHRIWELLKSVKDLALPL
jgi:sterol 3beta-glucosyltransferase